MDQGEFTSMKGLASALEDLGDTESAKIWRALAMMPALEMGHLGMLTELRLGSGKEDSDEQIADLRRMVDISRSYGNRFGELLAIRQLADAHMARKECDKAMKLYQDALVDASEQDITALESIRMEVGYALLLGEELETRPKAIRRLRRVLAAIEKEIGSAMLR